MSAGAGWQPPAYPYDRLAPLLAAAEALPGGVVDLSVGTPTDPPPPPVLAALADADRGSALRGYPPSVGTAALRGAAAAWMTSTFGPAAAVDPDRIGACVGTKEFVVTLPGWLKLHRPGRDTVLYPAVSYPSYAMGAELAGLRAVPVPVDEQWRIDLSTISDSDAARALALWVNTPGNPAGGLDDLEAAAAWGRDHDVLVFSDECYAPFTWDGPPRTILGHGSGPSGTDGVVALHSLSKRSNLAGLRVGWYSGDAGVVGFLREVRKHAGLMVPGPAQAAGVAALGDSSHVATQRRLYLARLERARDILADGLGLSCALPAGGFYLWVEAPDGDAWALAGRLAKEAGVLVSPGEFYGEAGSRYVRLAMVAPMAKLDLLAERLGC
ncbi:aminotransferase class I/II-fold pyridoxal phosphate-dependent enzyme [Acidiferrimicrobium sp. IK]|uniref:pyridoxal phosphate-dependent aminotransferase n=1 Tax=Acidiferrimicrobium sp. IK TaxID=2871700 RepID=UPI0021CB5BAA|nr:pyridoxal phosphate-dependent aminotransferase [Acidiferrimicrobium sp. IK]MCU4183715.1 aminotransferase class I/II-fold pyridoxal phosphate-dependent enzyme [Acidiferrimicrobium sp. IK]